MTAPVRTRHSGTVRLGAALGVSLGAVAMLAACSSAASSSSTPVSSTTPASSGTPATSASAAATGSTTGLVITTKSSSAGDFLTNGSGQAIYLWMKDSMNSSACSGGCASAWPPVTTTGALTAAGSVNKADLSTFTRSDGTKQVAYDGHPLYYFVGDSKPDEVTGQGSDGFGAKWWLVNPSGSAITTAVTLSASTTSGTVPSPSKSASGGGW
jgi:predicted lipoprotein with Yx(FWY)xxD motif